MIGNVEKMSGTLNADGIVEYHLPIGMENLHMNSLIGKSLKVRFTGQINCINCKKRTNKSFSQGYCFVCMRRLARCDSCIIKPEKCHYHEGTCREPEWGEANCLQKHLVYIANTGQLKVGITRHVNNEISSRWIDQGATQALGLFYVSQRLISGLVETEIAKVMGDKTNWRLMLKSCPENIDLEDKKSWVISELKDKFEDLKLKYGEQSIEETDLNSVKINYPVLKYPSKIKSINLDKELQFEAQFLGIKGQYLILDNDRVINIRKYTGYELEIEY